MQTMIPASIARIPAPFGKFFPDLMRRHGDLQPDLDQQQCNKARQADAQVQVGKVDQFDDRHQNAHQINLEHSPFLEVVIDAVQLHAVAAAHPEMDAQQNEQLTEQLEKWHPHAAEEHHQRNALHTALVEPDHTAPDGVVGSTPKQIELHDGQEVRRNVEHQRGQYQGQTPSAELVAQAVQLKAATRAFHTLPGCDIRS